MDISFNYKTQCNAVKIQNTDKTPVQIKEN